MPRYSYVVMFPVLIALCIGINIHRYPAVSAMLDGESVESRWLGRSEVFNFQDKTSESTYYQGYRSNTGNVTGSRASREPIPMSGLPSSHITLSDSTDTSATRTSAGSSHWYDSSYGDSSNRDSHGSRSNDVGNASSTNTSVTGTNANSFDSSAPYRNLYGSTYGTDSFPVNAFSPWGSYDDMNDEADERNTIETERSESRMSSDDRETRPEYPNYYDRGSESADGSSYRMDSPVPGYSSRYSFDETASTSTVPTETDTETEHDTPQFRIPLSLQEKLELRLATPFSWMPTSSQEDSSDQYIPPDFLPPPENGIAGKLVYPLNEPAATITPVTFDTVTPPSVLQDDGTVSIDSSDEETIV